MRPAAQRMADALADVDLKAPKIPLIANVLAAPVSAPDAIRKHLIEQVTGRVRWRESIQWLVENGVDEAFEIGAGKVLSGLIKRIAPGINASSINTPDDIQKML